MSPAETELELVERDVREAERHVANQREIVREISERGEPTDFALLMLMQFEQVLELHRQHLAWLQRWRAMKIAP